jgi:Putative stress-induced transcription regulator
VRAVRVLRFDAGSLSLNLVATLGRRFGEPIGQLDSLARLTEWIVGVGFEVSGRLSDADFVRMRRLREDLDALFRRVLSSGRAPNSALDRVNAAAATVPKLRATVRGCRLAPAASKGPVLGPILASTALDAIRIPSSFERADLRCCEAPDCRMLYLAHGSVTSGLQLPGLQSLTARTGLAYALCLER